MAIKIFKVPENQGISLKDMLEVSADKRFRVSKTPFGAQPGEEQLYAGRAVPWKGAKISAKKFANVEDFVAEAKKLGIPEKVARNIYMLAKDSEELKGKVSGYAIVEYGGKAKVMPIVALYKLIKKLKAKGRNDIIASMRVSIIQAKNPLKARSLRNPIENYTNVGWNEVEETVSELKAAPMVAAV